VPDELVAYFDDAGQEFEERGISNGSRFWYATDLMTMLGYTGMDAFEKAINKAIATCTTLGIPVMENFEQCRREAGARMDYKLSRFACYLVAMNGDTRKPQVARAQVYFARLADAAQRYVQSVQDVERVQIREDISERERSLAGTAKRAGVDNYAFFQNAGYRGMYNMDLSRLKKQKGMKDTGRSLLDFMDKRELAGNLFRVTETEARLQSERVRGQRPAEIVAEGVGRKVRQIMIENTGTRPELLPLTSDIKKVRTSLKQTAKEMKRIDSGRKPKLKK
jgi:DNA-damage-inducible protein D